MNREEHSQPSSYEKLEHKGVITQHDPLWCRVQYHWKLYYVYVMYVDRIEGGGLGVANIIYGAVIAKGQIQQEQTGAHRINWEKAVLMHEVAHCLWIWNVTGIPPTERYCEDISCVMAGRGWDETDNPKYCYNCWVWCRLLRKWSTLIAPRGSL